MIDFGQFGGFIWGHREGVPVGYSGISGETLQNIVKTKKMEMSK